MTAALIVENESLLADGIESQLKRLGIETVFRFRTEFAFLKELDRLASEPLTVALFDVMLNWCTPEDLYDPDAENPPPEVQFEGSSNSTKKRGGLRCARKFQEAVRKTGRKPVPVILYTMLGKSDLKAEIENLDVQLVTKALVPEDPDLERTIRDVISRR